MLKKITFLFLFTFVNLHAATLYVDASKPDNSGAGTSWATAKKDIQNAIDLAVSGDQVWVKAGVYYPNASPNMTASTTVTATSPLTARDYYIQLKDGVAIFGGFAGTETALSQRNISDNPTYIDGDIGVPGDKTDNCYHLMVYVGNYSTQGVTVDGFILRNGNATRLPASTNPNEETFIFANGFNNPIQRRIGGGMYVDRGLNNNISNIVFENNECEAFGAALYLYGNFGLTCTYNVINCYFVNNRLSASPYGAMCSNGGTLNCFNSVFYNNSCGIAGGDGVALNLIRTKNKIVNCTFAKNQSYTGSAVGIQPVGAASTETTEIFNCIFSENIRTNASFAGTSGYDFMKFSPGPLPIVKNCSLMHPSANYTAANYTEMDASSSGNLFEQVANFSNSNDIKGADGKYFTADDGLALLTTSPSKNTGLNSLLPSILTVDITYASRILATTVDMGAYEVDGVMSVSDTILAQIGNEADSPNTVSSVVTTTQLAQIVPAINGIIPPNQTAYQAYIDANPDLFSAPATVAEVQAMVDAVNATTSFIFYVDASKPDNSGDGLSWATAKRDLQVILDSYGTNPGPNIHQVWVKVGNHIPTAFVGTSTATRDKAFWVKGNVKIYGGFNGTETALNQRDIVNNQTILDGSGAYHTMLVTNSNATSTLTLIDGVTIKGGNANGTAANLVGGIDYERNFGGGVLCYQNAATFNNVIFKTNAAEYGAGVFNQGGAPKFNNCVFTENSSTSFGGGIENFENSNPVFNNCVISNNSAFRGGAAANNGGSATYTNCTIAKNTATVDIASGAFFDLNNTVVDYKNCIIWGNTTGDFITQAGSTSNVSYSVTQTSQSGATNLTTDPQFSDSNDGDGADNKWFTTDDGFFITTSSNCINSGDAAVIPSYITVDILNNSRIEGSSVDRGAYEVSATSLSNAVLTQIGNEGDAPNTVTSTVTVVQLGQILPAITGIVTANQSAYQEYIDANPDLFSAPATATEVQAMINTVNAQVAAQTASDAVLVQIGDEGDTPNTVTSTVTVAQLGIILPAITGIVAANESAYQAYIDANPNLFSVPATATEVQAMVDAVNALLSTASMDIQTTVIYPNPSKGIFYIETRANVTVELFDLTGKSLKLDAITVGATMLDLSNYASGIYFLKISNEINQTKTVRLIK